jgi:hypothetical protein
MPVQLTNNQDDELPFEIAIHAGESPSITDLLKRL